MDKEQFAAKVASPTSFSSQERGWLHSIATKYPFSSVVSFMAFLADHAFHFDSPIARREVALSVYDKNRVDQALAAATALPEETPIDILSEINTFQEVSFKTAPKSVILSNFLPFDESGDQETSLAATSRPLVDDKNSLAIDESLATETLAVILEKQGKYGKAIAIYEKLMASNPEKSSTFAAQIERLKSLDNTANN